MLTPRQLRDDLRRLLAGPRTGEAVEEARILIAAYESRQGVRGPVRGPVVPVVVLTPAQAADVAEKAKWRRLVRRSPASSVIYRTGNGGEPVSVATNEAATYARGRSVWR